ncbi:hypothetical protein LCGC14_0619570 [marine sediment metagenome]|uniref:Uncharacterized protein n=1 Tax=marine sediment metagenome TaxID=412755 RepID=A0A0F9R5F3_9ZZZZ|nr:hypothetical protein [Actinomycetota bacterium]
MDSEMLKVLVDSYESRIRILKSDLDRANESLALMHTQRCCLSHGGHEFVKKGESGCYYEECKHCGTTKDE